MASAIPPIVSITSGYHMCAHSFSRLQDLLKAPDCEFSNEIPLSALENELQRFRVWAGNIGAHRNGRASLDHKLREASHVHRMATSLLTDLNLSLHDATTIVSHERRPLDLESWPSDSSSDDELEESLVTTTEIQECFFEVTHVINILYKFSITIQNHVPRGMKAEKLASIDISHYEFFDIRHTSDRFPNAETHLINRLGKANSRRRQLFKYHKRRHGTLARYINSPQYENPPATVDIQDSPQHENPLATVDIQDFPQNEDAPTTVDIQAIKHDASDDTGDPQARSVGDQDHFHNSKRRPRTVLTSEYTQTTVSTFLETPGSLNEVLTEYSPSGDQSQTSYATSISDHIKGKLRVPPPPNPESNLGGDPFECPYCFSIITTRSLKSWKKHVFKDLRPYICTFKNCPEPDHLFGSRHDWFEHEVKVHRREWFCDFCQTPFPSKTIFGGHLTESHPDLFAEAQLLVITDRCERAISTEQPCPICTLMNLPQRFKRHVAKHMQQLALFTLPKVSEQAKDGGSTGTQASESDEESSLDTNILDSSPVGSTKPSIGSSEPSVPDSTSLWYSSLYGTA